MYSFIYFTCYVNMYVCTLTGRCIVCGQNENVPIYVCSTQTTKSAHPGADTAEDRVFLGPVGDDNVMLEQCMCHMVDTVDAI